MSQQPFRKFFPLAGSFALILTLSSCSRSEARRPPAEPEAVRQAVHDYGRSHQALLTPGVAEKPDQTDVAYSAHIRNILVQEDFAQLEKIAQQNRIEKGHLIGGVWKTWAFHNGSRLPRQCIEAEGIGMARPVRHPEKMECRLSEFHRRPAFPGISRYQLFMGRAWRRLCRFHYGWAMEALLRAQRGSQSHSARS